jgi:ankyrin repeat protein
VVVQCLVKELGVDVYKETFDGAMPLHLAAHEGRLKIVRYMVEELGVDINQTTQDRHTPLVAASAGKHMAVAAYLIKRGANPQASGPTYGTAVDISRRFGAPADQTAYLEAKMHCTNPICNGAGTRKCTGCKQAR